MEDGIKKIRVKTTLPKRPFTANDARSSFDTERLHIRPLTLDDLPRLHYLRCQPEVMIWTALGRPSADLAETRTNLDLFLAPNDAKNYNFAICRKSPSSSTLPSSSASIQNDVPEMIGVGGVHNGQFEASEHGWPEVGYMLVTEAWGSGYATEFLQGFIRQWWTLEKVEVEIDIDPASVTQHAKGDGTGQSQQVEPGSRVSEQLVAVVVVTNDKSANVLRKSGFKSFGTMVVDDSHEGKEGEKVTLGLYSIERPDADRDAS